MDPLTYRVTARDPTTGVELPVTFAEGEALIVRWYARPLPRWRRILRRLTMRTR